MQGPRDRSPPPTSNINNSDSPSSNHQQSEFTLWRSLRSCLYFLCWTFPILFLKDGLLLFAFVLCLAPAFCRFAYYYATTQRKSCRYGFESCRQTLDVYLAGPYPQPHSLYGTTSVVEDDETAVSSERLLLRRQEEQERRPVVIFMTGGAWMIGYKMWGALLARALTYAGCVVVIPDYRNYPTASVPMMVQDVEQAWQWTFDNCSDFGGDPHNIVIVGQSAGGHLATVLLLRMAIRRQQQQQQQECLDNREDEMPKEAATAPPGRRRESQDDEQQDEEPNATVGRRQLQISDLKGLISLSAPYSVSSMEEFSWRHGLDTNLVDRIFGGQRNQYDALRLVESCSAAALARLPPIRIYHGSCDKTVPQQNSIDFYQALLRRNDEGVVTFVSYENWSHTDAILEGPMAADHRFHRDIHCAVQEWTHLAGEWPDETDATLQPLCPHRLVQLARFFNPF